MNAVVKTERENQMTDSMELESVNNQLMGLLNSNSQKMEAFKTRMLKMATSDMLKGCTPQSLIACGLQALTLNLPLEAGQGYIVSYKKQAQLDVGYKGWQVLAKRSGLSVVADTVYKCDHFEQLGFGFDVEFKFTPNHADRKPSNDKWAKENLVGVIVSVREDSTQMVTRRFVDRDMIEKIIGMSPSRGSDFSPHNKWADQMFVAKAVKQVISKMPIDLSVASELSEAIGIVNQTEVHAQEQSGSRMPEYSNEKFRENFPKWVELVESGKKPAMTIITQLSNGFSLTPDQLQEVMTLRNHEPIEGESETVTEEAAGEQA